MHLTELNNSEYISSFCPFFFLSFFTRMPHTFKYTMFIQHTHTHKHTGWAYIHTATAHRTLRQLAGGFCGLNCPEAEIHHLASIGHPRLTLCTFTTLTSNPIQDESARDLDVIQWKCGNSSDMLCLCKTQTDMWDVVFSHSRTKCNHAQYHQACSRPGMSNWFQKGPCGWRVLFQRIKHQQFDQSAVWRLCCLDGTKTCGHTEPLWNRLDLPDLESLTFYSLFKIKIKLCW